ncbi:hypothetical protein J8273_5477 [Carpediemonas membranifera]|uniref:Phosphatidic acid phosphatase type 2/haloperoxidase domain-containing protein n=1 Tax=Carpediemonas membranifera TaxID=201153 RepID=A0A8J6E8W3_9EUKA|nr:hypothetical protein J8273_5477 [Carpediemonas membranifera]|eukprot:KAG9392485.1 hypothetical protein J8273_5477 [Carpediemonas membranifera]
MVRSDIITNAVPLEFAYVVYDPSSITSYVAALLTFWPFFIGIGLLVAFFTTGELWICVFGSGQLFNELVNHLLKNYFQDARPPGSAKTDFGFPSSHSQWCGYSAVFLLITLAHIPWRRLTCVHRLGAVLVVALCVATPLSRLALGVHSETQVYGGVAIGAVMALIWFRFASLRVCRLALEVLACFPGLNWTIGPIVD